MRLSVFCSLIIWASVSAVNAQEVVREFSGVEKKIENSTNQPKTVTLFDLEKPDITTQTYAIEGEVRYENVQGKSYLEMWSYFSDGNKYFSRTSVGSGVMRPLEGTSDWRPFMLPFFSNDKGGLPTRIVVNMVFVGEGTVYLKPGKLLQYHSGKELEGRLDAMNQTGWWSTRNGNLIGAIGGSIVGVLGAVIGILAGLGKARRFVLMLILALIGLGNASLIVGVIALLFRQSFEVYFPLLLLGGILVGICGGNLPNIRRRYEQIELRKMTAMDSR